MASSIPSINLLKKTKRIYDRQSRRRKRIINLSTIALIIYLAILLPIVGFRIYLSAAINSVRRQIDQKTQAIQILQPREQKATLLASKLSNISIALNSRTPFQQILKDMYVLYPDRTSIQSVSLENKNQSILVGAIANDIFSLEELFNAFRSAIDNNQYQQINITSLSRSSEGEYQISAEINRLGN